MCTCMRTASNAVGWHPQQCSDRVRITYCVFPPFNTLERHRFVLIMHSASVPTYCPTLFSCNGPVQVVMGYSGSVTITTGQTTTVGNTVQTSNGFTLNIKPRSNCSGSVKVTTYTQASVCTGLLQISRVCA